MVMRKQTVWYDIADNKLVVVKGSTIWFADNSFWTVFDTKKGLPAKRIRGQTALHRALRKVKAVYLGEL